MGHVVETVPFYNNFKGQPSLDKFPVVDKAYIRDNFELFRSQEYIDKRNHKVSTSGSTGNPFNIYHNKTKRERNTADIIYFAKKNGFEIGERLYYLRLWDKQYKKSNWLSWMQNIDMQSVDDLGDKEIEVWLNKFEKDTSTKSLLAYTSALQSIFKFLDAKKSNPLNVKVNSVIAIAEGLDDYVRKGVKKYFKAEVVSRYSNSENGIIAQQDIGKRKFEINWASYYVEILDLNHDVPVKDGESGRIVITDLFNYCMPMVRYDTGDIGRMDREFDGSLVFSKIEGRKMDMFTNTKGEYVSSHIVHHILQFHGIDQFQFIEEENNDYIIKLKVSNDFDYANEVKLINRYKEYFGEDAIIKVDYVNDIPLLASGKRKLVINKAMKNLNKPSDKTKESVLKTIN
jgi:phenylacetate-CoA ligase